MPGALPTSAFATASLDLAVVAAGDNFGRIYAGRHPNPLGVAKTPSRFSDPRRRVVGNRFGVLYLGGSLKVCFVEALIRDRGDGRIDDLLLDERELATRNYADVVATAPLRLLDLRGDGPLRMGIPSDVARGSRQALARRWSLAFHEHPTAVDGIIYPSRLNGETNLAIYDRAIGKFAVHASGPLLRQAGLAAVLRDLRVGLQ